MENYKEDQLSEVDLKIDDEVQAELSTASYWTKFISIVVFIFCGLFLLFILLGGSSFATLFNKTNTFRGFGANSFGLIAAIVIFVISLVVTVYYFLYSFSAKMKLALQNEDESILNKAIISLKIFFAITAVGSIISILSSIFTII